MKRPRFRRKIPDGRPEGEVTIEGGRVMVSFHYSPDRLAAIKSVPGARFHKDGKRWSLPITQLPVLERLPLFSRERMSYLGTTAATEDGVAAEEIAEIEQKIRQNPFAVPDDLIRKVTLAAVIRLNKRGDSLRVFPRFRSKAEDLVRALPGVHLIKSDQGYLLPTAQLTPFVKSLRDAGLSFATEQSTGERLSASAAIRASILSGERYGDAEELRGCVLTPFIDCREEEGELFNGPRYCIIGASSTQLKELLPDTKSFSERQKRAALLDDDGLLRVIQRARRFTIPLYWTARVQRHLRLREDELASSDSRRARFSEAELTLLSLPQCWLGEETGFAGLLVDAERARQIAGDAEHPLYGMVYEGHPNFPGKLFFHLGESILLQRYEAVSAYERARSSVVPESEAFVALRASLERRREKLLRRSAFQSATDMPLSETALSNPGAAGRLFPHQRVAVNFLLENERAFLGDDMGLGKTLSVLTAFDALAVRGTVDFILIACPNSLTRNWHRECSQWYPDRTLLLFPHEKSEKLTLLRLLSRGQLRADGVIINYEGLRLEYVYPELEKLLRRKRALLCLDESQRVKNPGSKTFDALSQVAAAAPRRVLLSGTPTPKDIADIWAQMYLLDDGERFGTNFYDWLRSIAELGNKYSDFAVKKLKPFAVRETVARVHEVLLRRKKDEVVNLPEKTFTTRDIELSGSQRERFEEICDGLLLRITSLSGRTFVREIESVLEEYLRAVQVASNPRLIDERWVGDPAKFKELDSIVEEVVKERDEKLVIWTNYLGNIKELTERYQSYGAAPFSGAVSPAVREETVSRFQNSTDLKILVAIPAAGGVGITLTAAQTAVYVDKTWNAEHWLQSIDRIHRIGQRGTVNIISLSACKVDELIASNLRRKERMMAKILGDKGAHAAQLMPSAATVSAVESPEDYPSREELLEALSRHG